MHLRWILCLGCTIAICFPGCVTRPRQQETRIPSTNLGTIGIISTSTIPKLSWQLPLTKAEAGQAYKSCGSNLGNSDPNFTSAFLRGTFGLGMPVIISAALAGEVIGSVQAARNSQVSFPDAAICKAVHERELQDDLRTEVFYNAKRTIGLELVLVKKPFPPGEEEDYRSMASVMCGTLAWVPDRQKPLDYLKSQGIDTALEIDLRHPSLEGNGELNPRMRLSIAGVARLIDVRTGHELCGRRFSYCSTKYKFVTWGKDDARLFRSELKRAYTTIGTQIITSLFADTRPPIDSRNLLAREDH